MDMDTVPADSLKRRVGSPLSMGFTLLLFCLPWIEVSCGDRTVSKSGLQIAFGGYTETMNGEVTSRTVFVQNKHVRQDQKDDLASWAMVVYVGVLLAGVVIGLAFKPGYSRSNLVGACCAVMLIPLAYVTYYLHDQAGNGHGGTVRILVWHYLSYFSLLLTMALVGAELVYLKKAGGAVVTDHWNRDTD